MKIILSDILVSQMSIDRKDQIPELIEAIKNDEQIDPILISEVDDDIFRIEDGTHRAVAYKLSGRDSLEYGEFEIVQFNRNRATMGTLQDLIDNVYTKRENSMNFNDIVNMILEDSKEDMFLDALDGSPKRELIKKLVSQLMGGIKLVDEGGWYSWDARIVTKRAANTLYTMGNKEFLRNYIEDELSSRGLDFVDLFYISRYGLIETKERKEEKRKQRDLGNLK